MIARVLSVLALAAAWPLAAAVTITTTSVPQGVEGVSYSATVQATGGKTPYKWVRSAGTLPPGISVNGTTGQLSGTPTTRGTYAFTIRVEDDDKVRDTQNLTITVNAPLAITTSSVPSGVSGTAYSTTLAASGGVIPYAWSLAAGALPMGVNLSSAGEVAGTPTETGTFNFTARVTDALPESVTKAFTLVIAVPLTITTPSLPGGVQGTPYNATLQASGGSTPYTWSLQVGPLPNGLSLSPAGAITGTPTASGTANVTVRVTDGVNATAAKAFSITIAPPPPVITTTTLPQGVAGSQYSATVAANGGTTPYSWTLASGALPAGLQLASATGVISGAPTSTGTANFTVRLTDATNATASQALSITVVPPPLAITTDSLPDATAGTAYTTNLAGNGGTPPYTWSLASNTLPAGLQLSNSGTISGTPTTPGSSNFTVKITDAANATATALLSLTVAPGPLAISTTSFPDGTVGTTYNASASATGGTVPYSWSVSAGTLPASLQLSASGAITGIPTTAGTSNFSLTVSDAAKGTATQPFSITVAPAALKITTTSVPGATAGSPYSTTLAATGGASPYTWSVSAGTLPGGIDLSPAGELKGTPAEVGNSTFTVQVTDASNGTATQSLTLAVAPPALKITTTSLPSGTAGVVYAGSLAASGGTSPYTWTIASGTLPSGLRLAGNGDITGTPTDAGISSVTFRVTDAANASVTQAVSITIAAPALTVTTKSLADATAGSTYTATLAASGGTTPYSWRVTAGALPGGLQLSSAGAITGTPTSAGTSNFTVTVTDAANATATQALIITVAPPAITISTISLPDGTAGSSYNASLAATGGTPPYTWALATGALPPALQLSTAGTITGTPAAAGTTNFTVRVTDSTNATATRALTISVAAPSLLISTDSMPSGVTGTPYSTTLAASGGVAPYTWSLLSGPLPPGISVSPAGQVAGTPSTSGAFNFQVRVADSRGTTVNRALSIRVLEALAITSCPLPTAVVGQQYSSSATATGGASPYSWAVAAGQLPNGLALNDTTGAIAGTPTQNGNFAITLRVTDSAAATATRICGINVGPALSISTTGLPNGVAAIGYSQPLTATGGTAPYSWSLVSGALPPGLTISPNGNIAGIPSQTGTFAFRLRVTDAAGTQRERDFQLIIAAGVTVAACPIGTASVGQTYLSALSVSGGEGPYSWAIGGGQLPPGVQIQGDVLRGTVSSAGQFDFRLQVSDRLGSISLRECSIQVLGPLTINTTQLASGNIDTPYSDRVVVSGGVPPYAWSTSAGALPPGLFLNSGTGQITGAPTNVGTFRFSVRVTDSAGVVRDAALAITITSSFQIAGCPTPAATVGQAYIAVLSAVGGQTPYSWRVSTGALPTGLSLNGTSGVISGNPTQSGTAEFVLSAADVSPSTVTRSCSIVVAPATLFVSDAGNLPQATLSVPYSATLSASGGRGPYTWQLVDGSLPGGLQLAANGQIQGVPSAVGSYVFTVRVTDADRTVATQVLTIITTPASPPGVRFTGTAPIATPALQMTVGVDLDRAYPVDITGTLQLSFEPDLGLVDDPAVQFAAGGRSIPFAIPANSVHAVFAAGVNGLQTGTVAGTIRLTAALRASGLDVTPAPVPQDSMRIDRLAPRISSVRVNRTANGIELQITGYSTTREVTAGTFRFTPAPGSSLRDTEVTVQMTDAARTWFSDSRSPQYGSQFLLVQPFTIQGAAVSSVSVTLTNAQGTSPAVSANF